MPHPSEFSLRDLAVLTRGRAKHESCGRRSLLLSFQLFKVELKFPALDNITINTAGLAWTRRDGGVETTRVELISDLGIKGAILLKGLDLALDGATLLSVCTCFIRFFNLLLVQLNIVLLKVPLSEGSGIDRHDGVLHKSLSSHELVVRRVVRAIKHARLDRHGLGAPREVTLVSSERTTLNVVAAAANVDALLGTKLGHGWHSAHLELPFFLVDWHTATRGPSLVPRVPRNTHIF